MIRVVKPVTKDLVDFPIQIFPTDAKYSHVYII